jgi:hypothetical protein
MALSIQPLASRVLARIEPDDLPAVLRDEPLAWAAAWSRPIQHG